MALCGAPTDSYETWQSQIVEAQKLPPSIGTRLSDGARIERANAKPTPPYLRWTVAVQLDNGTIWAGSRDGLMRWVPGDRHWRLFHSRRWLPDNHVQNLAVVRPGEIWVATPGGLVKLALHKTALGRKMAAINRELGKRHVRFGLVGAIQLKQDGKPQAAWFQPDSDNDGLWTALYVATESFRYGATGDISARKNAWASLKALMFLESITGQPGFVARSVVPISIDKEGQRPWERSADGKWWWKGDTSSDELDGHFFAYAVYYDVAATREQKAVIRPVVARIADHIMKHGYTYVDPSGRRTTWGMWAPDQLNRNPEWAAERGLNSMELLSYLKVAAHITGQERYKRAARELIEKHGYAMNTVPLKQFAPFDEETNHSDDELAFISYYPLLRYERDPRLRHIYRMSIERSWKIERPEGSPLFNLIYATALQAGRWTNTDRRPPSGLVKPIRYDRDICMKWFREVPSDLIEWTVINSKRRDLGPLHIGRHGNLSAARVLPIAERRVMRWNGNPYELDGGNGGRERDDGTFILLPYWMGRYHRLLD